MESILNIPGLKGVVMETFGSGNAPCEEWFLNMLKEAVDLSLIHIFYGFFNWEGCFMKVGIIRCMQTEDFCPGTTDFRMIREKKGCLLYTSL